MSKLLQGGWISPPASQHTHAQVIAFQKTFDAPKNAQGFISLTAWGIYEAYLNGQRIGQFVLAPGWTYFDKRLLVQTYDITALLQPHNTLTIYVGEGWQSDRMGHVGDKHPNLKTPRALIADLCLCAGDEKTWITTDESWQWSKTPWSFAELYDGEVMDLNVTEDTWLPVEKADLPKTILQPHDGEEIREQECLKPIALLHTPKGETVLDFGQNMTGYVNFTVRAKGGEQVRIRHAEVLDKDGNFYTDNLRSAKAEMRITLKPGMNTVDRHFSFYGFRYVCVENWPEESIDPNAFTAVVVHSDMPRTGHFACGVPDVNQLYRNIVWGQKGNYLDIPTDCPQRDERMGWTGDAQVFIKAGAYNYNVKKFFTKWLRDMAAEQMESGAIPGVIPNPYRYEENWGVSSAWGDAACVCPWQLYLSYGDKELLREHFPMMQKWVEYIRRQSPDGLWNAPHFHFGDWLGMDAPAGSYKGSTDERLIATAMYANSTRLLIQAGHALGMDMTEYEAAYQNIVNAYQRAYLPEGKLLCNTQTAHALTLHFQLCKEEDRPGIAENLCQLIHAQNDHLTTGFVGTPYLLHALSSTGHTDLAYTLLLNRTFPSWLFSVRMGATTIWEHWDGMREDGSMWSTDMNSFNHYAYGAVNDWLFGVAAGIQPAAPAYEKVIIAPHADVRLGYADCSYQAPQGMIRSQWQHLGSHVRYTVEVPANCECTLVLGNETIPLHKGVHVFDRNL